MRAIKADGSPWPGAEEEDGVAVRRAEADKEATYPELVDSPFCRLTVLACETQKPREKEQPGF